jgi:DNA-directed RNA polymerase specialized sigma24 family protein
MDPVLDSFRSALDLDDSDEQLGALLALHAAPVARKVVSQRLGASAGDAGDIVSQVLLQIMLRLRQGRIDKSLGSIDAFANYVAAAAHHACDHAVRRKHPARWRLRNRIRYVLEHDPHLAVWKSTQGSWLCGLAEWQSRAGLGTPPRDASLAPALKESPRDLLVKLFALSQGPLELAVVVDLAAAAWQIPLVEIDDGTIIENVRDPRPGADVAIDHRRKVERTWMHICELPVRQRQALLLNLKGDAINLFAITGTASLRALAAALEMNVETLASIWSDLPLSDNEVASRLGCTRQQVINLRMAGRKRLANRLAGWG